MDSIAKKLQLLNCPANMYPRAYKHIASLELISLEELEQILRLLLTKKIIIPKNGEILVSPENFCVLTNGYEVLNARIEEMEQIDELDAYREKLSRMNSKSAIENIKKMIEMGKPIKDGTKYSKVPFSIRRFNSLNANKVKPETSVEKTEVVSVEKQPEVSVIPSMFEGILSEPQEQALTDESFEEFERLMDSLQRIMFTVYGVDEVNDIIADNLIKLITSKKSLLEVQDDKGSLDADLLYTAITYGKSISEIEQQKLKNSIDDELKALKEVDIELGRAS